MPNILLYFLLPFVFCSNDYQLIRIWMKDVSSVGIHGVTDNSLFLSVDLDVPKLLSPDFKYAVTDIVEKQPPHRYLRNDDDFRIYGNCHWNQQVFRFFPDAGLILSERFPDMALSIVNDYLQLVDKKSVPYNWKWKVQECTYKSLYELTHSHFKLQYFLIDHFNTNSDLTNNTHVTVDDIQPEFIDTESNFTEIKQKQNTIETQTSIEQKKDAQPKKKNTTMWILISIVVILFIIGIFTKIGCFSSYGTSNQSDNLEETYDQNFNN